MERDGGADVSAGGEGAPVEEGGFASSVDAEAPGSSVCSFPQPALGSLGDSVVFMVMPGRWRKDSAGRESTGYGDATIGDAGLKASSGGLAWDLPSTIGKIDKGSGLTLVWRARVLEALPFGRMMSIGLGTPFHDTFRMGFQLDNQGKPTLFLGPQNSPTTDVAPSSVPVEIGVVHQYTVTWDGTAQDAAADPYARYYVDDRLVQSYLHFASALDWQSTDGKLYLVGFRTEHRIPLDSLTLAVLAARAWSAGEVSDVWRDPGVLLDPSCR